MNNDFDEKHNRNANKVLTLGHFTVDTYSGFISPILPFIAAKIGITLALAGSVISIAHLLASFMQPFYGFLADIFKKRFFIFWGVLLSCVFYSLTGLVTNYWQLVACLVLGSLGNGLFHPQATGFINYFSSSNISKTMASFIAMGTIGFAFGPLVSSSVVQAFSLEALPYLAIWGFIMALAILIFVPRVSAVQTVENRSRISFFDATKIILKNKTLMILIMISMLKSLIVQAYCIFLPFLWKSMGYSVGQIGLAIFFFCFVGGVATYMSSRLEKKIGTRRVFYISMMSVMPLTILYALTYKAFAPASFVLFSLVGFVSMLSTSVNMTMAQNTIKEHKSMVSGYIGGFSWGTIGVLFAPISLLAQHIGIINLLLIICVIPFACSYLVKYLPEA
jgi:FSR family fosmidomycin resistance protein-like MFS transporter